MIHRDLKPQVRDACMGVKTLAIDDLQLEYLDLWTGPNLGKANRLWAHQGFDWRNPTAGKCNHKLAIQ